MKMRVCVMLEEFITYVNTIKGHPGKIFINFERDGGSLKFSFLCVLLGFFTKFLGDPVMK